MNRLKLLIELARLKEHERMTPARMKRYQAKKLRKMLVYAFRHSSYYHRAFVRAGIDESNIRTAPLSAFPVMDKQTLLQSFAQPLIRYHLTDSLTLVEPTKKPFTRAAGLLGRSEDMLWFEHSLGHRDFLHPLAIEGFCVEGLRDYQFRQTGRDSFVMLAEIVCGGSESLIEAEITAQMREILEEKGLGYVRFDVEFVHEILPDPITGKKRLILGSSTERWAKAG